MYLEPIFGSEDIMRQLPTEARRFKDVDSLFRATMKMVDDDAVFIAQANPEKRLLEKFSAANEKLDKIQKGLADYLEMKRLVFPRFFFLSDDQMLEILSQTKNPLAVQPHLGKAFEGVNEVHFEDDLKISQMISVERECVALDRNVNPEAPKNKGNVELWLLELENVQWDSIRTQCERALAEYPTIARPTWTLHWPAQVVLVVSQIFWTQDVQAALADGGTRGLQAYTDACTQQMQHIVLMVRGDLSKLERKTLSALVVIDVHARDTTQAMCKAGVSDAKDFEWVSQLRYYWEAAWKDGQACREGELTCVARIVNARVLYGYEYLGNSSRLVITPLTDRCYRTMISAIDLLYGCLLYTSPSPRDGLLSRMPSSA